MPPSYRIESRLANIGILAAATQEDPQVREAHQAARPALGELKRESSLMRTFVRSLVLGVALTLAGAAVAHAVELQWWSHWAIEDNKKAVLFEVKRRFEA